MKPINLQGHSRPIKKVKFNESGELLFTASSDRTIVSWSIPSGEKQKTFNHSAAINTFCVTNKHLISGDNTGTIYIWEISSGKILKKLEHDPTLSVRSLDYLQNDQSQIMVVYAGRAKLAKSFISIYNINDILNYGEKTEENKSASLIDITSEALKEMKKLSLPVENNEGNSTNVDKENTNKTIDTHTNLNTTIDTNTNTNKVTTTDTNTNTNTVTNTNTTTINTNTSNVANTNSTNSDNLKSFAGNLISTNNNNNLIRGNINEFNNSLITEQKSKPTFTPGRSIYDEENSIYAIYANKPKEPVNNNQNSNYKFANQNNFNGNMNNNNLGAQQGYNFNNNNGGFYNQNQQMGQGQQQQGNYRFNNNNNFNNRNNNYYNNNQFQNNNMQDNFNNNNNRNLYNNNYNNNNGSLYNNNNNNNNNSQFQQNQQNQNTGGFQRNLNFQNNNNLFNPLKGNSYDPNPSIIQRQSVDSAKITVSYEKIIPMKQIEIPNTANTKYVAAKFFSYNDKLCIAVSKENGFFEFINYVSSKVIHEEKLHTEIIFDFDFESSENLFLTVSKDGTACVYDFNKYKIIKTFKPENPVRFLNTCKIHKLNKNFEETVNDIKNGQRKNSNLDSNSNVENNNDNLIGNEDLGEHLNLNLLDKFVFVIAGGQDSKLVTTTKEGGFEIIGFNMEMEESIFMHLANFGPVNTIDLSRKNNFFVSGSEDSSVKLLNFDQLLISNGNGIEKK